MFRGLRARGGARRRAGAALRPQERAEPDRARRDRRSRSTRRPRCGCISRRRRRGRRAPIPAWQVLADGGGARDRLARQDRADRLERAGGRRVPARRRARRSRRPCRSRRRRSSRSLPAASVMRPRIAVCVGGWPRWRCSACSRSARRSGSRRAGRRSRRCADRARWLAAIASSPFSRDGLLLDPIGPAARDRPRRQRHGVRGLHPHARAEDGDQQQVRALRAAGGRRAAGARAGDAAARRRAARRSPRSSPTSRVSRRMTESSDPRAAGARARRLFRPGDRADRQPWRHGRQDRRRRRARASSTFRRRLPSHTDAAVRCALAIVAATDEFRRDGRRRCARLRPHARRHRIRHRDRRRRRRPAASRLHRLRRRW